MRCACAHRHQTGRCAQAVDTHFRTQVTIGVMTFDQDCYTFYARLISGQVIEDISRKTLFLSPPEIHAQKHIYPVLGFGPAGSSMNGQKGIILVMLAGEHALQLKVIDPGFQVIEGFSHLLFRFFIFLLQGHFKHQGSVFPG